jgi:hypothetical protein
MNRSTVYRYLRVAKFLKTNVDLNQQLVSLSISKLYALSRLKNEDAIALVRTGKAAQLNDLAFLSLTRRLQPQPATRQTVPNLVKALEASLVRLDRSMRRWHHSAQPMPVSVALRLKSKLRSMERALDRMGRAGAVAM